MSKKVLVIMGFAVLGLAGSALPAAACNWWCDFGSGCKFSSTTTNMYCHEDPGGGCWEEAAWGCFAGAEPSGLFAAVEPDGESTLVCVDATAPAASLGTPEKAMPAVPAGVS